MEKITSVEGDTIHLSKDQYMHVFGVTGDRSRVHLLLNGEHSSISLSIPVDKIHDITALMLKVADGAIAYNAAVAAKEVS